MGEYTDHHDNLHKEEEEEEEEEALSLCDLPLDQDNKESSRISSQTRRSSSESPELFEFFSDISSEMCLAEDIIFGGKLLPFKDNFPPVSSSKAQTKQDQNKISFRRRSESLSELQTSVTRSSSIKNNVMRTSRSLDYRKLERFSSMKTSPESNIERNSSTKSVGKGDTMAKKMVVKPRWFVLMFGVVKPPTEMELSDIKSRQVRRNVSSTMFPPPVVSVKKPPINRNLSKGYCTLLRALSCHDHASVAVTTSLCMPQV